MASQVAFVPEAGVAVSVYLNKSCAAAALEINYTILAALLEICQRNWRHLVTDTSLPSTHYTVPRIMVEPNPDLIAELPLECYEGAYSCAGNGTAVITKRGDHLSLKFLYGQIYDCHLYPLGGHRFLPIAKHPAHEKNLRVEVTFLLDQKGPAKLIFPEIGEFGKTQEHERNI